MRFFINLARATNAMFAAQIGLLEPATDLTSVMVQWGAGDPTTGTDQVVLPLEVIIEASLDGGKEWCSIVGGDGVVDVAHTRKLSPGSSQHRYPVSLLALHRKRCSQFQCVVC